MNGFRSVSLLLLLVILLGSCNGSPGGGCQLPGLSSSHQLLGSQAPNFRLPNLAGEVVELSNIVNEKPTLLVFWASWCPTCREEIPILNEWIVRYPGLQIVGINVQEPAERVKAFVEKEKLLYPVLLDQEAEIAHQYGLVGIPASILTTKGGRIIYYGFALPRNIERLIQE